MNWEIDQPVSADNILGYFEYLIGDDLSNIPAEALVKYVKESGRERDYMSWKMRKSADDSVQDFWNLTQNLGDDQVLVEYIIKSRRG